MDKDKELTWKKLSEPYRPGVKTSFNSDGTMWFKDSYGDGMEVDVFDLSTPYDMTSATFKETEYVRMWG